MRFTTALFVSSCLALCPVRSQEMEKAEEPEQVGMTLVSDAPFPAPDGLRETRLADAGFERGVPLGASLRAQRFERVEGDAPEGTAFGQARPGGGASLHLRVRGWRPYLLSFWLRSDSPLAGRATSETAFVYFGKHTPLAAPSTGGTWRRVGLFFRTAPGATAVSVSLKPEDADAAWAIDDIRFREATEEEFSQAWNQWRSQYPERDLSPQPGFGRNLQGFVEKLTEPVVPGDPLLVMGIGSSYTNMLGNGERIVQWVRETFPGAPPVEYRKHVGSAVNYDFTRGWMRQHVLEQQPDLVILYSGGTAEDLELLLSDFRAHSSADVIVASLHLRERSGGNTPEAANDPVWDEIRTVAEKYACEWVDSRREWSAYLTRHGKPIEWLLKDAVHQNDHGALVINENIVRHIVETGEADREARAERFVPVDGGDGDEWTFAFRGIRVEGVWRIRSEASRFACEKDGKPLGSFPAFHTTLIKPGRNNRRPERGMTADRSPHMIRLGDPETIVPQEWTIRMTSDVGDYELTGSVTGPDGKGNNAEDFTSDSGQITVPAALWRRRLESDGSHSNGEGDTFTWTVKRAVTSEARVPPGRGRVSVSLADQLPFTEHELRVRRVSGDAELLGFIVHEPAVPGPEQDAESR